MDRPQNVICPECGTWMVSRVNHQNGQRFWGCHLFPECTGTRDTDGQSKANRMTERNPARDELPSERRNLRRSRRYE